LFLLLPRLQKPARSQRYSPHTIENQYTHTHNNNNNIKNTNNNKRQARAP